MWKWDKPEVYGVARKRVDVRDRQALSIARTDSRAMTEIINNLDVRHLVISFNNEGYISKDAMIEILSERGQVTVVENDFKRYVGAQIGIHSPNGEKVGEVSHVRNKEYLFVVSSDAVAHTRLQGIQEG